VTVVTNPGVVSLALGILTVLGTVSGYLLVRMSKRDEIREQRVAQTFQERNTAFEQLSAISDRYKTDADYQRTQREQDRIEHEAELTRERERRERERLAAEGRWERQLNRCRKALDESYATITELIRYIPEAMRAEATHTLQDLEDHRVEDHPES
jgi:hypothetical protein